MSPLGVLTAYNPEDCMREKEGGTVFQLTGGYEQASLNPARCQEACEKLALEDPEITLAGLTQGNLCLCGRDPGKNNNAP